MADPGLGLVSAADEVVVTKQPLLLSFFSRHDSPLLPCSFYSAEHAGDVDQLATAAALGQRKNERLVTVSFLFLL